jgi:hypothetical protein
MMYADLLRCNDPNSLKEARYFLPFNQPRLREEIAAGDSVFLG